MSHLLTHVQYSPRGVSNHSLRIAWLRACPISMLPKAPWKRNAFWMQSFPSHDSIESNISHFFDRHSDVTDMLLLWDSFKAYIRGVFISEITAVKRATGDQLIWVEQEVRQLEQQFIASPSNITREAWQSAQAALVGYPLL